MVSNERQSSLSKIFCLRFPHPCRESPVRLSTPSSPSLLDKILAEKSREVALAKGREPLHQLKAACLEAHSQPSLTDALQKPGFHIIGELKKASPSKGILRADFDIERLVRAYETAGVSALSVLTDAPYFQGSLDNLRKARALTGLPLLRKDFIIDSYQLYQAKLAGAYRGK